MKKTGEHVRVIRFKSTKEFDYFLSSYRLMRYPGYDWRLVERKK
jgi:hypothetical protein